MRILLILMIFITPALAQDNQLDYRLDRLERDMLLLQRQIYREEVPLNPSGSAEAPSGSKMPQLEIRLSNIEEQMRQLYGRVEQLEFQVQRLQQMATNNPNSGFSVRPKDLAPAPFGLPENKTPDSRPMELNQNSWQNNSNAIMPDETQETLEEKVNQSNVLIETEEKQVSTPEELYKKAFVALSEKDFMKSRKLLQEFIVRYPNHELIGNAYYWIGETFYVEKDYIKASSAFKEGYEAMPEGHKAHDNLLKLGLSLENLGKQKEACVIYNKLISEEPAEFIARRAEAELRDCE